MLSHNTNIKFFFNIVINLVATMCNYYRRMEILNEWVSIECNYERLCLFES